jgi:hypothetical protein
MNKYLVRGMVAATSLLILGMTIWLYPRWETERLVDRLAVPNKPDVDAACFGLLSSRWVDGRVLASHLGDRRPCYLNRFPGNPPPVVALTVGDLCFTLLEERWEAGSPPSFTEKNSLKEICGFRSPHGWIRLHIPLGLPEQTGEIRDHYLVRAHENRFGIRLDYR